MSVTFDMDSPRDRARFLEHCRSSKSDPLFPGGFRPVLDEEMPGVTVRAEGEVLYLSPLAMLSCLAHACATGAKFTTVESN